MTERWYCASALTTTAVAFAAANLANQHFDSFCPIELNDKGSKPLFGSYFFVSFDPDRDRWRSILGTRGVKTLLGLFGERPMPLPIGAVEDLQRRAENGEFDKRVMSAPKIPPIAPGTPLRVLGGPFEAFEGICLMSTSDRVRVLLSMFGRQCLATIERKLVEVAA